MASIGKVQLWTEEEDARLRRLVEIHGVKKWSVIADEMRTKASKQCRRRWQNYLNCTIKKGSWTPEEDVVLLEGHGMYGNRWTEIAKMIPGRTDNAVKNRYMAISKKNEREAKKKKESQRFERRSSRGGGEPSSSMAGLTRDNSLSGGQSSRSQSQRLCPSPKGLPSLKIPDKNDQEPGPLSDGLHSILRTMSALTPGEIEMLQEVGMNSLSNHGNSDSSNSQAVPTSNGLDSVGRVRSDEARFTRARSREIRQQQQQQQAHLASSLNLSTPLPAVDTPSSLLRSDSVDWQELMNMLLTNPLPATPLGEDGDNNPFKGGSDSIPGSSSGVPPLPTGRMTRGLLKKNSKDGKESAGLPTPGTAGSSMDIWGPEPGSNSTTVSKTQQAARLNFLRKMSMLRANSLSQSQQSQLQQLVGGNSQLGNETPTPGAGQIPPDSLGGATLAAVAAIPPNSPGGGGVRRSPRIGPAQVAASLQRQSSIKLDPDILQSPAFSQTELNLLLSTLSDVVSPTQSPRMTRSNSRQPFS